jgi:hypothetical protein
MVQCSVPRLRDSFRSIAKGATFHSTAIFPGKEKPMIVGATALLKRSVSIVAMILTLYIIETMDSYVCRLHDTGHVYRALFAFTRTHRAFHKSTPLIAFW